MLSQRVREIEASKSVGLVSLVTQLRQQGRDIISLSVGEPDLPPPPEVIEATHMALKNGHFTYGPVSGERELREEIAKKLNNEKGFNIAAENILVSNGSKQILYNLFQIMINPGDEVIIPVPYWVTFPESVKLAGGVPVFVSCKKNFQLDVEKIKSAITRKTKAIILNSPNNPTGAIFANSDLKEICALAVKYNFQVISDEAYEFLTYESDSFRSPATFDKSFFNNVITVQTFSKSHCMTGFRVGYMAANKELITAMDKLQGHVTGNVCSFAQFGAIAALKMDQTYFNDMKKIFMRRRDLAYSLYSKIFPCEQPQGAFYLFPKCDHLFGKFGKNSDQVAKAILEKANVALLPGSAFGLEGYLRLSFASSEKMIEESYKRIKNMLDNQ